jgi:ABC-type Zn uptake system ZnuABC Zn-binding protein ZnuA
MRKLAVLLILLLALLGACARPTSPPELEAEGLPALSPAPLGAGERLRVVATTTIVGDVVARVGGDAVQLTVLLPPGADPHTYEPTPADLTAVAGGARPLRQRAGAGGIPGAHAAERGRHPVVPVSAGIQPRLLEEHGRSTARNPTPTARLTRTSGWMCGM